MDTGSEKLNEVVSLMDGLAAKDNLKATIFTYNNEKQGTTLTTIRLATQPANGIVRHVQYIVGHCVNMAHLTAEQLAHDFYRHLHHLLTHKHKV